MTGVMDDFAGRLDRIRRRLGLTQAALAAAAKLSPGTVAFLEQRRRAPKLSTVMALAKALGVNVDDLTGAA